MTVTFEVPGPPRSKGSARFTAGVTKDGRIFRRTHVSADTVVYENRIAMAAVAAMGGMPPMGGPLMVCVIISFAVPASWSKRKRDLALAGLIWPTIKPDASNTLKAVEDGCKAIVMGDDAQIVIPFEIKRYAEVPGLTISVRPAPPLEEALAAMARLLKGVRNG